MSRGTPHRVIRSPESLWAEFGEAARAVGTDRSDLLRQFMRWATHKPGAEMPERPDEPIPART